MEKYKFIDHIADIAVVIYGNTIEELLLNSVLAFREAIVEEVENSENPSSLSESSTKIISLKENSFEEILVNLLSEINYYFHTQKWICISANKININKKDEIEFSAEIFGEEFNPAKHNLKEEIKAVTFHQMKIENVKGIYSTKIVFDI